MYSKAKDYSYYPKEEQYAKAYKRANIHKEKKLQERDWSDPFKNIEHKRDGAQITGSPLTINDRMIFMSSDLKVSDLPKPINNKNIQLTNFFATEKDIDYMLKVPKFIISRKKERFISSFIDKNSVNKITCYARTVYYLVRPDTPSHLPLTYRMSIAQNIDTPDDWTICLYAMAGGVEKGLMFLKRLDHSPGVCHKEGDSYIPTPHMHSAKPQDQKIARPERTSPEFIYRHAGMNLEQGLNYSLREFNVSPALIETSPEDNIRTLSKQLRNNQINSYVNVDILKDLKNSAVSAAEYYTNLYLNEKRTFDILSPEKSCAFPTPQLL